MVLFGGTEKGVSPDKFPKPPTTREMLEDIEALSQADPVLTFTHCLLRKGKLYLLTCIFILISLH